MSPTRQPRYDLPRAAPPPLDGVQRFVNTVDLSHEREWLADWLGAQGLDSPTDAELERARAVREAIRELLYANNAQAAGGDRTGALDSAANAAMITIDFSHGTLLPRAPGLDGILGSVAIACFSAMANGTWRRLKCCRNCRWAFYDDSRNRSATWCSMQICGNRAKTRTYRQRARGSRIGH